MNIDDLQPRALEFVLLAADWLVDHQCHEKFDANFGRFPFCLAPDGKGWGANNWNLAFGAMAMFAAEKALGDAKYHKAALEMMGYLKRLQIFDPYLKEDYGAIRELTPQTPWCYMRDALSAAWGLLELYRETGDAEALERAKLWFEWFLRRGMDSIGYPLWGVRFEPGDEDQQMRNDMRGSFQGGGLNFFYQMYRTTGDRRYVGHFFENIADYFVEHVQQPDGFFRTVEAATGKVPATDPQNGLHRVNDDLGTLGLLCALQVYPKETYRAAIGKFLAAVFARQEADGHFEASCAGIPVVLNVCLELGRPFDDAQYHALEALFARQFRDPADTVRCGALDETGSGECCARSLCYSIIVLCKLFAGERRFLTVNG